MKPIASTTDWRDYRRDTNRAGIQSLPRANTPLNERWSTRLGGGYQTIQVIHDHTNPSRYHDLLMVDAGGVQRVSPEGEFRWKTPPFGAHGISFVGDLDADGRLEILTTNGREVIILSAEDGAFLFRDSIGPPFSYGTYAGMIQSHPFFRDTRTTKASPYQFLVPCFSHKEVLMYDCSGGAENTRILHRLWMDDGFHPSIVIGDVNKDGIDEIVIARLGGVYVFSPHSGEMISQTLWNSDAERRRNYGQFQLSDIDDDGDLEAIILSDKVTRHIAVLDNDGKGNFAPLWDRFIEHIYPNDTTELRYTAESIKCYDGLCEMEIAVSIFNGRGDNRWYTEILSATTGAIRDELPDQYLRGVQSLKMDDLYQLCLSKETSRTPSYFSELSIYDPFDGITQWTYPSGHFAERTIHAHPIRSQFKPDAFSSHEIWQSLDEERPSLFVISPHGELIVLHGDCTMTETGFQSDTRFIISEIDNEELYVSRADGDIIKVVGENSWRAPATIKPYHSSGYHLTTEAHIAARPAPVPSVFWSQPVAASNQTVIPANAGIHPPDLDSRIRGNDNAKTGDDDPNNDSTCYLAVPDFANNIHLFRADVEGALTPIKTIKGRSRLGYDNVFHSSTFIETTSGSRLIVVDDEGLDHSRLSLYSLDGEYDRSYNFPDLPASIPGNRIGCYDWLYFQHSRGEAMFASFYQSQSMNSECSLAFLLESGEILWRVNQYGEGDYGRGIGPWGASALRIAGDKQIAVFCAKDTLCQVDLETGAFWCEPKLLTDYTAEAMKADDRFVTQELSKKSSIDDPFTAYGTPIIHNNDIIIAGSFGGFGIIRQSSDNASPSYFILHTQYFPLWWHVASFGDVLYRMPGIGDIDGDGRIEFGQGHADGTFGIYDYETGALRDSLELHSIATDVLTLDFNSDGQMEFILGTNDGRLLAIGHDGEKCSILAEHFIGAGMGSPIAADLNGDGTSEIYVVSADGMMRCFG